MRVSFSQQLSKPPALSKHHAVRFYFVNQELRNTNSDLLRRKEIHKASAANATRRCSQLESRLSEIEHRAAEADKRVAQLRQELQRREGEAAEAEKRVAQLRHELEGHEKNTASSLLRRKLLNIIKTFHPDRMASTTPTEVTKKLNALLEEFDLENAC